MTCSASDRWLGVAALFVAANYGLMILEHLRRGDLDAVTIVFISPIGLALIPLWWWGAMTFWFRFRIDIDRDKFTYRARVFDPRERMAVLPLRDFINVSTMTTGFGQRLFFEFASRPDLRAPRLWLSGDELADVREWISSAAAEMISAGAPMFAARDDDGQAAARVATIAKGPALAPWAPPPRAVPLWHRVQLVLDARVAVSSIALMIFAPSAASAFYAADMTSPWLLAAPTARTTAVIEACEETDFRSYTDRWVRRISYRFEAGGVTWRSSSYDDQDCPPQGTPVPVEYPVGFPSTSRLRNMNRHPLPPVFFPIFVAIVLYALGHVPAAFVAAARTSRFLREGRISLAVFETQSPFKAWYGSAVLLVFRVLVGGREVRSAYSLGVSGQFEREQLILYDPRRPARREFTGLMGAENLSAFRGLNTPSVGGTLFVGAMLAVALWLVFRAIHSTILDYV